MSNPIKLTMTKIIKAKRSKVFEAWANPDMMKLWMAPGELIIPSVRNDAIVGGSFTIHMEGMMRGRFTKGVASGVYKELIPNELVVLTWNWVGDHNTPETLITVKFKDVGEGTEVTLIQEGFADEQHKAGYEGGWLSAFEKLSIALN
ncbi:MAG: SRPBCC family protein [Leptospirales bacterium]